MRGYTRREFNALVLTASGAALLPACSASAPDGVVPLANGRIDLPFSRFARLSAPSGSVVVDVTGRFPVVVVRTTATEAVALSATCPHKACLMGLDRQRIHCDCHDANFTLTGAIIDGPVTIPIPTYAATVGPDGITVEIDA